MPSVVSYLEQAANEGNGIGAAWVSITFDQRLRGRPRYEALRRRMFGDRELLRFPF